MYKLSTTHIVLFILFLASGCFSDDRNSEIYDSRETAITRAIEKVSPAVVGIHVTQVKRRANNFYLDPFWGGFFQNPRPYKVESMGSGVIISPDGYVVTNAHVVENAFEIIVILSGGSEYKTSVIGIDDPTDVALLKLPGSDFPYSELADSDDLILGEWVIALGNPLGLFSVGNQATATVGILSGTNMDFGLKESGRVYQDMLQTDASINQGNSGGPLVNSIGKVIGLNTFIMTGTGYTTGSIGIGFAIPINRVKEVSEELKLHGKVERQFTTGVSVQPVDRYIQRYLRLPSADGVIITDIEHLSSGENAGLKIGDVILKVDGILVNSRADILKVIGEELHKTGDYIQITAWRDDEKMYFQLMLAERN